MVFYETPPFGRITNVQWLRTGMMGGGTGYQSSTAIDLVKFNHRTGAVEAQISSIGKYTLGYGVIAACCIDYRGNLIVAEFIVNPQPSDFGPTGWTAGRLLHKYNSSGGMLWSIIPPETSGTYAETIRVPTGVGVDSDNNIYLVENTHVYSSEPRATVIKFTPEGSQIWSRNPSDDDAFTYGLMTVPSGGCVVAWSDFPPVSHLTRYDADGVVVWTRTLPGAFMSGTSGTRSISQKPSETHFAACFGSWFTEVPTTALFSVETGATLWSQTHGINENHSCDIGGSGDSEAVFVFVVIPEVNYTFTIEKRSILTGALLDSVRLGSADRSPQTGYPIICTGTVVVGMRHDHTEFDVPFVDRWDDYNYYAMCYSQDTLSPQWQKYWGRLSGFMDNEAGPFSALSVFGRAPA